VTSRPAIAVLDYGMGNLRSVQKAFEHVGADAHVTSDAGRIRAAAAVVLPGVGAFPKAMAEIGRRGLDELVVERLEAGTPTLGICLGMQLLFERSSELGGSPGLGLLPGEVQPLPAGGLKLPQIGWNPVRWLRDDPLIEAVGNPTPLYHVHSFAAAPADPAVTLGVADYGEEFATAVARPPLYGVQFHPEKSGPAGLALLANLTRIARAVPA
jgi:imidazole glycerol-phosphate synthase subunit HisH